MSIKVPTAQGSRWSQPNNSDKFGNLWYTLNCNFDEEGYLKLSPRTIKLYSDAESGAFNNVVAIGRQATGDYQITASGSHWSATISPSAKTFSENDGTSNPTTTADSHGIWFAGLWHASTATSVLSRAAAGGASATWTSRVTGLTSGANHVMCPFPASSSFLVANGNTLRLYDSAYSLTATLTIPADFEIIGLAYNRRRVGIITRLANASNFGQDQETQFFVWDGSGTTANDAYGTGSDATVGICAYKSTWLIVTRTGELKEFNGGGFTTLASFPFFFTEDIYGDPQQNNALGTVQMVADGDIVHINIGISLNSFSRKREKRRVNTPSGSWCYDPKVGLYHRYSPSASLSYVHTIANTDINTTTDLFTTSGTIPATGNIARLTQTAGIGGLTLNSDYYIIKVSATTFRLATSKANALANSYTDITSATAGNNYFWMYDLVDFGMTYHDSPGAIAVMREKNAVFTDVMFGARFATLTALGTNDGLCMAVPFLENRGCFVTPKVFSGGIESINQKLVLKFRPLKTTDSLVVKYRDRDVVGVPVTSAGAGSDEGNWTSPTELYTTLDLSEAKTYLDAGGDLEIEIVTGAGSGATSQITAINEDNNIYSLVLEEEIVGASSGRMCHFIIHNWKYLETITSTTENADRGFAHVIVDGATSKFAQFKVEMRGSDITIEEWDFNNPTHQSVA